MHFVALPPRTHRQSWDTDQCTESAPAHTTDKRQKSNTQDDAITIHVQLSKRLWMGGKQSVEELSLTSKNTVNSVGATDETESEPEEEPEEI